MNIQSTMEERQWRGRNLTIYLPPTYHVATRLYPVVYIQDGGKLMGASFRYMERLFYEQKLDEIIVVGVHSEHRNDEYTPWEAGAVTEGRISFGGKGRAYLDELADHIKPWIDSQYRTLPDSAHTGLMGGSLGGLISLFGAYWRPDTFGSFGLLSASLWYEGVIEHLEPWLSETQEQRFYVSIGNKEGIGKRNRQREMVPNTLKLCSIWRKKGMSDHSLHLEIVDGATHDFLFMAQQLPKALAWLFPYRDTLAPRSELAAHVFPNVIPYTLPGTEQFDIVSGITGLPYRIFVHVPLKPAPSSGYPVLYAVDGNAYFGSLHEAMQLVTRHPKGLPSGVIVGIGYPNEGPFVSERRFYDLTTPAEHEGLRPDGSPWPINGGVELFLNFIEQELMPLINQRFNINTARQALFGHSLGGYFTLHTLMTRPSLFRSYVAGSPSLWWDDKVLFRKLPEFEAHLTSQEHLSDLLFTVGSEDKGIYENAKAYYEKLLAYEGKGLNRLVWREFAEEGHVSVLPALMSPMLRFLFADEGADLRV